MIVQVQMRIPSCRSLDQFLVRAGQQAGEEADGIDVRLLLSPHTPCDTYKRCVLALLVMEILTLDCRCAPTMQIREQERGPPMRL